MRNLIIDCDPGQDDATAILLALAYPEELNVQVVTTVCGNNTLANVTENARYILDVAGKKTLLAAGAERPLVGEPIISHEFHGKTGMDGHTGLSPASYPVERRHAVDVMRELILAQEKTTLAALGPLTNLALLFSIYPEVKERVELITLMGGGLANGNITPYAEFNIYVDPEAAAIVFRTGVPIVMSGLDVTQKALLYPEQFRRMKQSSRVVKFFRELMEFYGAKAEKFGAAGCMMHDPCAIAWLLWPELFQSFQTGIEIELVGETRGRTVARSTGDKNVLVLTEVNAPVMMERLLAAISRLDRSIGNN